jgi:nucleotide-binding universal stress UspA family protein
VYKKILIPLDGSTRAEKILTHVQRLAAARATLILLQVVEPGVLGYGLGADMIVTAQEMEVYWQSLKVAEEAARKYLERKQTALRKKNFALKIKVVRGDAVRAIVKLAAKEKVDLIAMSSHGRTGLKRVFYGSVANGVLHQVDRPLLLIRSN